MRVELPSYDRLRESGARPRVHGNGFLQLDLTPDVYGGQPGKRLHIWHSDLPRQATKSSIHDHVFDMESVILCGKLTHVEFTADTTPEGEYSVYYAEAQPETNNTILATHGHRVDLRVTGTEIYFPWTSYTFPAFELHDSFGDDYTATIITKTARVQSVGTGLPRVLVPYGEDPDNEFDREGFDPETLWPFVQKICWIVNG